MKITIVRHGQTESNFEGIMQGRSNHLMNDTGRRQCQKLRDKLKDKHFDVCYMSPLVRCVETAFIIVGDRVEMIRDDRLILVASNEQEKTKLDKVLSKIQKFYKKLGYESEINIIVDHREDIQDFGVIVQYLKIL